MDRQLGRRSCLRGKRRDSRSRALLLQRRYRTVFTFVELLVVIAIIGILVSLLLPAVQMARESARRTQCANQIRQLALGMLQHHATMGFFLTNDADGGYIGDPALGYGDKQIGGWIGNTLPFIEQQSLHDLGRGLTGTAKQTALSQLSKSTIPAIFCFSRRGLSTWPLAPYRKANESQGTPFSNTTFSQRMLLTRNELNG